MGRNSCSRSGYCWGALGQEGCAHLTVAIKITVDTPETTIKHLLHGPFLPYVPAMPTKLFFAFAVSWIGFVRWSIIYSGLTQSQTSPITNKGVISVNDVPTSCGNPWMRTLNGAPRTIIRGVRSRNATRMLLKCIMQKQCSREQNEL